MPPANTLREDQGLTSIAFTRLLEWLDDGVDSHGGSYLEMRRRLVLYFDRRNRPAAEELADETLNRAGRTLEKSGRIEITPPARYCYTLARFVLLEDIRRDHRHVPFEEPSPAPGPAAWRTPSVPGAGDDETLDERRLDCLDRCLRDARPEHRDLVIEYYQDTGRQKIDRRRAMAGRLGISMNALGVRACRIRASLETCVEGCCKGPRQI